MKTLHEIKRVWWGFLLALFMLPGLTMAGIDGSGHDFFDGEGSENLGWATGANGDAEICIACHTPHNGKNAFTTAPLWNSHTITSATYTLYSSVTGTMDSTNLQQPSHSMTKLCLSCHDGQVALDSFRGGAGSTIMTGSANFGTDLQNDHPIGIKYTTALIAADGELQALTHQPTGIIGWPAGKNIEEVLLFGTAGSKTVECASCHDVHNSADVDPLLRFSNEASRLCLACHDK